MAELNNSGSGQWSETDASNTSPSPDGWAAGTFFNQVEPNARSMMGAIKRFWDRVNGTVTTTGASGTYTYTPVNTSFPTAYKQGETYSFKADKASAGNDVININLLGAIKIYKATTAGIVQISANDVQTGAHITGQIDTSLDTGAGGYLIGAGLATSTSSAPFDDATAIVKGSSDPTKLLRFEVDGFTTATTRVVTPPNEDFTIVGLATTQTLTGKTYDTAGAGNVLKINTQQISSVSGNTSKVGTVTGSLTNGHIITADASGNLQDGGVLSTGSMIYLSTQTASASATIDFTSLITSTYDDYVVIFDGVIPVTGGTSLYFRTSSNNGSSYDAGANNYAWGQSGTLGSGAGATEIDLGIGGAPSNNAAVGIAGTLRLYNLNSATVYKRAVWDISYGSATGSASFVSYAGAGARISTAAVNAIRFLMQGGNISTGTFKLYGIKKA